VPCTLILVCPHALLSPSALCSKDGYVQSTSDVAPGAAVGLVLEATSFYAEAGGQTADTGAIAASAGSFDVEVRLISRVWASLAGWLVAAGTVACWAASVGLEPRLPG
jgi:hypothetical protein